MKLSRSVARFNKVVTNRLQGVYALACASLAVILHRRRRSGRAYRTPVLAFRQGRCSWWPWSTARSPIGFAICG